jgi:hypothetical protein
MARQLAHLANSIRHTQYPSPNTKYEIRDARYEQVSCKTNPICRKPEYALTSLAPKAYAKNTNFSPPKANPNKPNQSQSDPRFSPVMAPQSQNKPKQTQSIASLSNQPVVSPSNLFIPAKRIGNLSDFGYHIGQGAAWEQELAVAGGRAVLVLTLRGKER